MAQFKKNSSHLNQTIKKDGKRFSRLYKGKDVGVACYILYHSDGVMYEYVNESRDYIFEETVEWNLINCKITGTMGRGLKIYLRPGQSKTVDIRSTGRGQVSAKISKCTFVIEPR